MSNKNRLKIKIKKFDKNKKSVYSKTRNESHRQCVLPKKSKVYTTQLGKAKCGVFLYLFVSPHYIKKEELGKDLLNL